MKDPKGSEAGKSEVCLQNKDVICVVEISDEPIADVFGRFIGKWCICRDITTERILEEQWRSVNTDVLTGLYNGHCF